jgi:IMP cyclohydrolase
VSEASVYCGRFVGVCRTRAGAGGVFYRVSSRSFPNRTAVALPDGAAIVPRDPREAEKNPYIAYRCLRHGGGIAVASNGSHTDALFERIAAGMPPREALAFVLLAFDYEHDQLNTPRIAACVAGGDAFLGIVRHTGIQVETVALAAGEARFVATYEIDRVGDPRGRGTIGADDAPAIAKALFDAPPFAGLAKPVCGAVALGAGGSFQVAVKDAGPAAQ